ncbi:hypothetical protein D1B31_02950 [Neobacillus notoginsengisoli]|uniref:Uncharacterized protein n=1 Tax=Neobacillus notoginsengisoli TaxID=1578198 RepID=A0A417YXS0_9BACI|nr:hypothetical protein D1B31_02950 [Neobacillus notoginsengisoli]
MERKARRLLENAIAFPSCKAYSRMLFVLRDKRSVGDPAGACAEEAPRPPAESAPRDRQKTPVPAMIILRSFPLWSGNQI